MHKKFRQNDLKKELTPSPPRYIGSHDTKGEVFGYCILCGITEQPIKLGSVMRRAGRLRVGFCVSEHLQMYRDISEKQLNEFAVRVLEL